MSLTTITIIFISSFSLAFAYINTTFTFVLKSLGATLNINAKSFNLTQALLILNSFFVAVALTSIAFLIDTTPKLQNLLYVFQISLGIITGFHILMLFKFKIVKIFVQWLMKKYFKNENYEFKGNLCIEKKINFDFVIIIAWSSYLLGFIFPSILAVIFNEFRTTLFQLSFIFNSLGTFLTILIIEKKLAIMSDQTNKNQFQIDEIMNYLSAVVINRVIASLLLLIILLVLPFCLSL